MPVDHDHLRILLNSVRDLARMVVAEPDDPRAAGRLMDAKRAYARVEARAENRDPALDDLRSQMHLAFPGDINRRWLNAFDMARAVAGADRAEIARAMARDAQDCIDAIP